MSREVAILGGGCGGLAAAWALTDSPELRGRFSVTVYQMGWRLGGKGASGRLLGSGDGAARIEEHGLHIWFGFYEHAFRMLRAAYEESGLASGDSWWTVPFEKCNAVSLYERHPNGTWIRQSVGLPQRGRAGSGPPTDPRRPPLARAVAAVTRMVALGVRSELRAGDAIRRGTDAGRSDTDLSVGAETLDELATELDRIESDALLGSDVSAAQARRGLDYTAMRSSIGRAGVEPLLARLRRVVEDLRERLRRGEEQRATTSGQARLSLWRGVLELVGATISGFLADGVLWRGLAVIDGEDLREWLGRHGASAETLERSPVLRGLYDLTFAYRGGDKSDPSLAAGKGVQSLLMMINYEGAFMWRMRAGMGDVVFSPLYLALRRRGVKFNFFSRVTEIGLGPDRTAVESIELVREASIRAGADRYEPIERIGDWWCWPSEPYDEQLEPSPRAGRLVRGTDFDDVVLAIPVGAQRQICRELADANPRYARMLSDVGTVRTKALQLWLTRPIEELRLDHAGGAGAGALDPPATAYAEPFDTYCDMSHLLGAEGHGPEGPKGVAYFCAVLPDGVPEQQAAELVREYAREYLEREAAGFWPGAIGPDGFDWDVLHDPLGRSGPERLEAQYVRANTEPSDLYVTTAAGSVDSRLEPGDSGFQNLVLAGDWTHNDIDGGCVEAAVISGLRAGGALIRHGAANCET